MMRPAASWRALAAAAVPVVCAHASSRRRHRAEPPAPGLVFAFEARVEVGPPLEVGQLPRGLRRIVPILRGTFEGPGIKGRVMPGGADWQIIGADGFSELDTRYTLETDTGRVIYVQNAGIRHAPPEVDAAAVARRDRGSQARVLPHRAEIRDLGPELNG